ncbi:MAG: choice-of-anchor Q domain-containing protein [Dokdonella sp.]
MDPLMKTNQSSRAISRGSACRALMGIGLLVIGAPASAATIVVTTTADTGADSFRQAVLSANPGDTITFDLPAASNITLFSPVIIDKNLTLQGPGRDDLSLSGHGNRVLEVGAGVTAVIGNLEVTNGVAETGGGFSNHGTTTVSDCSFTANSTGLGASVGGNRGGAIYNDGDLTVSNCHFAGNIALGTDVAVSGIGGAIENVGTALIERSSFVSNQAYFYGGAIDNTGMLTVIGSTFSDSAFSSGNQSKEGGAIYNVGTLVVDSSTFVGNLAHRGGAIRNFAGSATVTNSTLVKNTASSGGGAIWNQASMSIIGSTIAENSSPAGPAIFNYESVVIRRSLFAFNDCYPMQGSITSEGDNLLFGAQACVQASEALNDRINVDPLLLALADNGGPTMTRMPAAGSPAIDEVRVSACTGFDQRGISRPQGSRCDIGAVEVEIVDLIFKNGFDP